MPVIEKNVSVQEVMGYLSGDFGVAMSKAFERQIQAWENYQDGQLSEWAIHSAEIEHGGPEAYVNYLAKVMRVMGWVGPPLAIEVLPGGRHRVNNGHHRFIASPMAGLCEMPARIHFQGEEYED